MKSFDLLPVRWGLLVACMTLFMGVYLGMHFGKNEHEIKEYLKAKATASSFYKGDEQVKKGAANGWKYLKRSHEHFQGLGSISVALILLLSGMWIKRALKAAISIGIAVGGLIYPLFWYLTAYRAADIGKSAAKESLALMAQFGAGLYFVSFVALFATVAAFAIWKDDLPGFLTRFKE